MNRVHATVWVVALLGSAPFHAEQITLSEAVRRATERSAPLTALAAELRAADAAARQAGRRTNPEVELSVENAGAEDAATETTVAIGQLVELGGDRRARIDAASAAREIVRLEYDARRRDVEAQVRSAFASLVAAQQQLAIARENLASAEAAFGAIRDRVAAGKVSPIEETRAAVTVSMERIELGSAEADVESARIGLAALWGGSSAGLDVVEETPTLIMAPEATVAMHPDLQRAEAVVAQREAEARVERARGVPDLRASAGVRGYEGGAGPAAVAGVSMALPFFDRNRDAVAAALARVEAARSEVEAVRVRLTRDLQAGRVRLTAARQNADLFRTEIIPAAESVYEAVSEGYRLGKFGYLEVLDARRTLADARQQLVAAQRELALVRIDVARLTGGWK